MLAVGFSLVFGVGEDPNERHGCIQVSAAGESGYEFTMLSSFEARVQAAAQNHPA